MLRTALHICLVCVTALVAGVSCAVASESRLAQMIDACASGLSPDQIVSASTCPRLFDDVGDTSSTVAEHFELPDPLLQKDLIDLSRFLKSIGPASTTDSILLDSTALSNIMDDYSFETRDEQISLTERFNAWLAEKLKNSGLGDKLESFGDRFSMDPETRSLVLKIIAWTMGIALVVVVLSFLWVLWRYLDPILSRRRVKPGNIAVATGAGRGNVPVMALTEIQRLPADQQPAALLVACLDRLKGKELPNNIWKATNSEIIRRLNQQRSVAAAPIRKLVQIAEQTLYGEQSANQYELESCFDAANTIFAPQAAST